MRPSAHPLIVFIGNLLINRTHNRTHLYGSLIASLRVLAQNRLRLRRQPKNLLAVHNVNALGGFVQALACEVVYILAL